ncbi:ATP-binding protein [Planktothrix agardhii]|jgi:hypothetical protein|uniref:ATP-binding protein n=1 Tax=Planktothrix agardhii TaxID=1160 RepID=UPI001D09A458|nr:ATP-binding protein [Planktothrix agardhii]MCB8757963.1 ATP-binding protein [Planktothrix agardhii 1813]MCB8758038.1 ATP-binding protein [Planktothrix agardhii 1813]
MQCPIFESFDPLEAKTEADTEVKLKALKNEIKGILTSYVGWYDPFSETIQNAMDSVEKRATKEECNYSPKIWITINLKENMLMVTDNGIGLDETQFKSFLTPFFSFKSKKYRGHKGVGATYLAYAFNYIQLCTKTANFVAVGKMINARDWVDDDESSLPRPQVTHDNEGALDQYFNDIIENNDMGVSICIKFDRTKDLTWVGMKEASAWLKVLRLKTALGAMKPTKNLEVFLYVIDKNGKLTQESIKSPTYLWIHQTCQESKSICYKDVQNKRQELIDKHRNFRDLPRSFQNKLVIYGEWSFDCSNSHPDLKLKLEDEEKKLLDKHKPYVYCAYVWSVNYWNTFSKELNYRVGNKVLFGGIQVAANNMPQGETISIPLGQNITRQNNAYVLIHFDDVTNDLGRKNYTKELVEISQKIASRLVDILFRYHQCLKPTGTGTSKDSLALEQRISDWKKQMEEHEKQNPLNLINENFFIPTKKISITSTPSREQDVIALFNQMIAGGVIRGIQIMATNERFDYDGLYRIIIEKNSLHAYNKDKNPLGIQEENLDTYESQDLLPFKSEPKVLEYKYSLDGLVEDIGTGTKKSKDINLVVVWETGEEWRKNYQITTTLHEDHLDYRPYHGITHKMSNFDTSGDEMEIIVLQELIEYLNDPESTQKKQLKKYEDYED